MTDFEVHNTEFLHGRSVHFFRIASNNRLSNAKFIIYRFLKSVIMSSSVTPAEHTAIGGLAGLIEVGVMQPTVAIKNAIQEGRPMPTQISAYYRGLFVCVYNLSNGRMICGLAVRPLSAYRLY